MQSPFEPQPPADRQGNWGRTEVRSAKILGANRADRRGRGQARSVHRQVHRLPWASHPLVPEQCSCQEVFWLWGLFSRNLLEARLFCFRWNNRTVRRPWRSSRCVRRTSPSTRSKPATRLERPLPSPISCWLVRNCKTSLEILRNSFLAKVGRIAKSTITRGSLVAADDKPAADAPHFVSKLTDITARAGWLKNSFQKKFFFEKNN